jgi:hypothetical protein
MDSDGLRWTVGKIWKDQVVKIVKEPETIRNKCCHVDGSGSKCDLRISQS